MYIGDARKTSNSRRSASAQRGKTAEHSAPRRAIIKPYLHHENVSYPSSPGDGLWMAMMEESWLPCRNRTKTTIPAEEICLLTHKLFQNRED